jgi:hypothetical protein
LYSDQKYCVSGNKQKCSFTLSFACNFSNDDKQGPAGMDIQILLRKVFIFSFLNIY